MTHTGTCPYSGYSAPCTASSDFSVRCRISGAGNYSFSYSPNGLKTSGSSASGQVVLKIAPTGGGTKTVRKTLSLTTPTTTTQPTTFLCGGDVEIDIVD